LYQHPDVLFLDSFFTKRKKQWEAEAKKEQEEIPIMASLEEQQRLR
jgi:DNA replication protein DnaC